MWNLLISESERVDSLKTIISRGCLKSSPRKAVGLFPLYSNVSDHHLLITHRLLISDSNLVLATKPLRDIPSVASAHTHPDAVFVFVCSYVAFNTMDFIFQFNTSLPLRVLLMCWGPYVIMCAYACFDNVKLFSPKLRMVCLLFCSVNTQ